MRKFSEFLYAAAIVLWVGGLWVIGYLVAPTLFHALPGNRGMAGHLAGLLFSAMAWVSMACAAYLLAFQFARRRAAALKTGVCWLVLAMLALTLAGHFGVQPILAQLKAQALPREVMESVLRDRFAAWHGVSSVMYLIQSLLGAWLVAWRERGLA